MKKASMHCSKKCMNSYILESEDAWGQEGTQMEGKKEGTQIHDEEKER